MPVATKTFNGDIDIYMLKKNGNTVMIKGNRNASISVPMLISC